MLHGLTGPITLDCDVLSVDGSDLRVVLYTAAPNTPESDALQTLRDHIRTRRL
jgi:MmyB-like transcription regulator ligand binding domain